MSLPSSPSSIIVPKSQVKSYFQNLRQWMSVAGHLGHPRRCMPDCSECSRAMVLEKAKEAALKKKAERFAEAPRA